MYADDNACVCVCADNAANWVRVYVTCQFDVCIHSNTVVITQLCCYLLFIPVLSVHPAPPLLTIVIIFLFIQRLSK